MRHIDRLFIQITHHNNIILLCAQVHDDNYYVHDDVQCAEIWNSDITMPAVVMKELLTQWRCVLTISGMKQ